MRPESASVRNTEDKVCSCTRRPRRESEKEGRRSQRSDGEDAREARKREEDSGGSHGDSSRNVEETRARARASARVIYADCKSAIMSLSRVYANPQHRRSRSYTSPRSTPSSLPLVLLHIASFFSSSCFFFTSLTSLSSFRPATALPLSASVERLVYTQRCLCDSFLRKAYRDGTIISVDYAIITQPSGGGHFMPLARPRRGLPWPTPKGYVGPLRSESG